MVGEPAPTKIMVDLLDAILILTFYFGSIANI
jgi:hypothetical protein